MFFIATPAFCLTVEPLGAFFWCSSKARRVHKVTLSTETVCRGPKVSWQKTSFNQQKSKGWSSNAPPSNPSTADLCCRVQELSLVHKSPSLSFRAWNKSVAMRKNPPLLSALAATLGSESHCTQVFCQIQWLAKTCSFAGDYTLGWKTSTSPASMMTAWRASWPASLLGIATPGLRDRGVVSLMSCGPSLSESFGCFRFKLELYAHSISFFKNSKVELSNFFNFSRKTQTFIEVQLRLLLTVVVAAHVLKAAHHNTHLRIHGQFLRRNVLSAH